MLSIRANVINRTPTNQNSTINTNQPKICRGCQNNIFPKEEYACVNFLSNFMEVGSQFAKNMEIKNQMKKERIAHLAIPLKNIITSIATNGKYQRAETFIKIFNVER